MAICLLACISDSALTIDGKTGLYLDGIRPALIVACALSSKRLETVCEWFGSRCYPLLRGITGLMTSKYVTLRNIVHPDDDLSSLREKYSPNVARAMCPWLRNYQVRRRNITATLRFATCVVRMKDEERVHNLNRFDSQGVSPTP